MKLRSRKQRGGGICDNYELGSGLTQSTWPIHYAIGKNVPAEKVLVKVIGPTPELIPGFAPASGLSVEPVTREGIELEFAAATTAGEIGVGPRIHCTKIEEVPGGVKGYLVMDRISGKTFDSLYKTGSHGFDIPPEVDAQATAALNKLYTAGVQQLDTNLYNFMYDAANDKVWLIDFGKVIRVEPGQAGLFEKGDNKYLDV
jgi:hypothetical protein